MKKTMMIVLGLLVFSLALDAGTADAQIFRKVRPRLNWTVAPCISVRTISDDDDASRRFNTRRVPSEVQQTPMNRVLQENNIEVDHQNRTIRVQLD